MLACNGNAGDGGASLFALFSKPLVYSVDSGQTLPLTVSIVNDSTPGGATFTATSGTLGTPSSGTSGSTEQVTVNYTAPTVTSTTTATVTATSVYTPAQSVNIVLTVAPALHISTTTLPTGAVSSVYSTTLATSGGTGSVTWSVSSGSLPTGITLNASSGTLSGTPTTAGTYTFTIAAQDSSAVPATAVQTYNLVITPPLPVVTTTSLPYGQTGSAYSQQLAYTGGGGGTATWAIVSGSLPSGSGLTLSSSGLISGTPAVAGTTYNFSVTVTIGTQTSVPVALSFIAYNPVVITTTTLNTAHAYSAYSQQLTYTGGSGGTPTFVITSGSLPVSSGLTLSSTGLLSGTPTSIASYSFSVTATVGTQTSAAVAYTLTVSGTTITSGNKAYGEVGLPFLFQNTAVGGTLPYTWSISSSGNSLPANLSINSTTGLISGNPATASGSPFTNIIVQASDAHAITATNTYTVAIGAARGASNSSELNGQYAFLLSGFDAAGHPLAMAGSFIADGAGHITGGVADTNGTALVAPISNAALTASTYSVGSNNRGQMTLTTSSGATSYVITLDTISGVASSGTMTEFDSTGQSLTGTFALQTASAFSTAAVTGGFAFGLQGFSAGSTSTAMTHSGGVGEVQLNGTTAISSAEMLLSSTGSTTPIVPTSGSFSAGANGRGTLSLSLSGGKSMNLTVYVVSASTLYLISSDPASGSGSTVRDLLSGTALAQTVASGSFSASNLNSIAVVRTQALGVYPTYYADIQAGLYTFTGTTGKVTAATDENAGGMASSNSIYGTYTVAANGRVTASLLPGGVGGCLDCAKPQTFFYLAGNNEGFLMDFTVGVTTGFFEPQTGSSFTASSFSGGYSLGTLQPMLQSGVEESGYLNATGAGAVTGSLDQNLTTTLAADVPVSTTYTVASTGRIALASGQVIYLISPTKGISLDLTSSSPLIQEIIHQ
jgi:hypothetical protein